MRRSSILTTAITLCVSFVARSSHTYAQSDARSSKKSNSVVYLADMLPTAINKHAVDEEVLKKSWKVGQCLFNGKSFNKSISVTPNFWGTCTCVYLNGDNFDYFEATIGIDDHHPDEKSKVRFIVTGDDKILFQSSSEGTHDIHVGSTPKIVRVPLKNIGRLTLDVDVNGDFDKGEIWWGNARFIRSNALPAGGQSSSTTNIDKPDDTPSDEHTSGGEVYSFETHDVDELAKKMKAQVEDDKEQFKTRPVSVAIALFDLIPKTLSPDNARKLREQLNVALTKTKTFRVVERGQLDKILEELKRSKSDITDPKTAQNIGKQVNARNVLIGSISDEKTYVQVNVRMINTETGESSIAESVEVKKH